MIALIDVFTETLRGLDLVGLAERSAEVACLPDSPLAVEMRLEVELEWAGRRWRRVHDLAGLIGWEAALQPGAVSRTRVGAA